jgi:thiosulfate dehydrogenase [quinone] large subunit
MENKKMVLMGVVLRLLLGWYMFCDAYNMFLGGGLQAQGFLLHAKTFPAFYAWFGSSANSVWINPVNMYGILAIGVALLLGVYVRPAAWAAAFLMIMYYFPHYAFPYVDLNGHIIGYIVDEHIVFAAAFILIAFWPAVYSWGLSRSLRKTFFARIPLIGQWV